MSNIVIARKYALALVTVTSNEELEVITIYINGIRELFNDSKFMDILSSPIITKDEKVAIITDKLSEAPAKFINFIKILAESDRLEIIPQISEELLVIQSSESNTYTGYVESDTEFSSKKIEELKTTLSSRLGISLDLQTRRNDYDGIKVEIPDMGLRIDYSQSHIKEQMLVHILKAI
jgi:F-type H+-transporting ATPase subunit delta